MRTVKSALGGVLALALLLPGCSSSEPVASAPGAVGGAPVLLSMDLAMGLTTGNANGTQATPSDYDDAWALALLRDEPSVDILGIVVTMGNGQLAPEMVVARRTLEALDMTVPLVAGSAVWLPVAAAEESGGEDLSATCVNEGVEFMATQLRERDDVTVLATGPLTDVACLALAYPAEADRIAEVIALVGSLPGPLLYDGKAVRDFNYSLDPRALSVILEESQVPFTAVTFEASSSAAIPIETVTELAGGDDPLAQYFGGASQAYADWWESILGPTKPVWDAAVVWRALHPEDFTCGPARFDLRLGAPNLGSDDTHDWFIPDPAASPRVTACTAFAGQAAIDRMNRAVLTSVGGTSGE